MCCGAARRLRIPHRRPRYRPASGVLPPREQWSARAYGSGRSGASSRSESRRGAHEEGPVRSLCETATPGSAARSLCMRRGPRAEELAAAVVTRAVWQAADLGPVSQLRWCRPVALIGGVCLSLFWSPVGLVLCLIAAVINRVGGAPALAPGPPARSGQSNGVLLASLLARLGWWWL